MAQPDYSLSSLYSFIEYIIEKGLVKKATAKNWKNASSRLLSILDADETNDLRKIDVDSLCQRYANINGKDVMPSSLKVYRSRLKTALIDFVAYTDDPMSYSPSIVERSPRKKKTAKISSSEPEAITSPQPETPQQQEKATTVSQSPVQNQSNGFAFPVPLRENLTIQIMNVPFDLTEVEAEKIGNVIKALASIKN